MKYFKIKTWHIELAVIVITLCFVTIIFRNNLLNWITTIAIIFTFQHAQIGDRLQERQSVMNTPTVECYYKLNKLFAFKEICWILVFLLSDNYAALVGSIMFLLYPVWRKYYRKRIKPMSH